MAWLAKDFESCYSVFPKEHIFVNKPTRFSDGTWWGGCTDRVAELPFGTIKKLIGRELKWSDEPVEI